MFQMYARYRRMFLINFTFIAGIRLKRQCKLSMNYLILLIPFCNLFTLLINSAIRII